MSKASKLGSVWTSIKMGVLTTLSLIILTLNLSTSNASPHTVAVDPTDAWTFTCRVLQRDCTNIPIPEIVVLNPEEGPCFGVKWGAYSPYFYPDKIFLCGAILYYSDPVFVQSVVAHEFTHYLDTILTPESDNDTAEQAKEYGCWTEWNAHRVGNAYVYSHGHKEWADWDWQDWYGCYHGNPEDTEE